jgi:hypothetical protein
MARLYYRDMLMNNEYHSRLLQSVAAPSITDIGKTKKIAPSLYYRAEYAHFEHNEKKHKKLHGLSPRTNYSLPKKRSPLVGGN